MIKDYLKYFVFVIPLLFVYLPSQFFPVNNAGAEIPFRPPPLTFAIVWPILLILIGFSWFKRLNLTILYFILCILLGLWPVIYNYSKIGAFIEIIITLLFSLYLIFYKYVRYSSLALIPLVLWLSFASLLNGYEILV